MIEKTGICFSYVSLQYCLCPVHAVSCRPIVVLSAVTKPYSCHPHNVACPCRWQIIWTEDDVIPTVNSLEFASQFGKQTSIFSRFREYPKHASQIDWHQMKHCPDKMICTFAGRKASCPSLCLASSKFQQHPF